MAAACAQTAAPQAFVLRNEHLAATFATSDSGPRLAAVEHRSTGEVYRFERSEEIAMAIVPRERVSDPKSDSTGYGSRKLTPGGMVGMGNLSTAVVSLADLADILADPEVTRVELGEPLTAPTPLPRAR